MQVNLKDMGAGGLFLAIGLYFSLNSWFSLAIGSGYPMGPGFFPLGLGLVLCCFGLGILIKGLRAAPVQIGSIPWRGLVLVFSAVLFFALAIGGLGVLPALAGCTMLAAMAPRDATWRAAAIITVALTAFCVAVFIYGLRLPYPVIAPWILGH